MSFAKINQGRLSLIVSILLGLAIAACGGGGGGGGSANQGVKSSGAASKAVINALGAADMTDVGNSFKPAFKANIAKSDPAKILLALEGFKNSLGQKQQKVLQAESTTNLDCNGGGSGTLVKNDQGTPDPKDDSVSLTADHCVTTDASGTTLLDGAFSLAPTQNGGFHWVFTNFLVRDTTPSGKTDEDQINGTLDFSGEEETCNQSVFLKSGTLTANLTSAKKVNENGDQTLEVDESSTMTNFILTVAEAHDAACNRGATTLTLNGTSSFTNALSASDNFTATFTNLAMVLTPATRTIDNVVKTGETMSIAGTVAITSSCANGTFTLSTPADDLPFIPDDEDCPVQGRILISDGTATTAVIATKTGGVQIDDGNNGSIDREFSNCNEAKACT